MHMAFMLPWLAAATSAGCLPHCANPCAELNGNLKVECGACVSGCHPGSPDFGERVPSHKPHPSSPRPTESVLLRSQSCPGFPVEHDFGYDEGCFVTLCAFEGGHESAEAAGDASFEGTWVRKRVSALPTDIDCLWPDLDQRAQLALMVLVMQANLRSIQRLQQLATCSELTHEADECGRQHFAKIRGLNVLPSLDSNGSRADSTDKTIEVSGMGREDGGSGEQAAVLHLARRLLAGTTSAVASDSRGAPFWDVHVAMQQRAQDQAWLEYTQQWISRPMAALKRSEMERQLLALHAQLERLGMYACDVSEPNLRVSTQGTLVLIDADVYSDAEWSSPSSSVRALTQAVDQAQEPSLAVLGASAHALHWRVQVALGAHAINLGSELPAMAILDDACARPLLPSTPRLRRSASVDTYRPAQPTARPVRQTGASTGVLASEVAGGHARSTAALATGKAAPHLPASVLQTSKVSRWLWSCCGGEVFLLLPGIGLVHMPRSAAQLHLSTASAAVFILLVTLTLSIARAMRVVLPALQRLNSPAQRSELQQRGAWAHSLIGGPLRSMSQLVLSLAVAWASIGAVLRGPVGRMITALPCYLSCGIDACHSVIETSQEDLLHRWHDSPHSAPFAAIEARRRAAGAPQRAARSIPAMANTAAQAIAHGGAVGNVTFWTPTEAAAITVRILASQHRHWTAWLSSSYGVGIFIMGVKHDGLAYGGDGQLLTHDELGSTHWQPLWSEFADVYERLRERAEQWLDAPARLFQRNHWPPSILIHMPSVFMTHPEAEDMHVDAVLPEPLRHAVEADVRIYHGWESAWCDWEAQLSLLAALAVPSGGAGLEYYGMDASGSPELRQLEHAAGRAMLIECARPHKVRPLGDVDGLEPRIVMHSFVVPCWRSQRANGPEEAMEYVLIGPIGGLNDT